MQGAGGYPGNRRLYTPGMGLRYGDAKRPDTLPNILWKASGVAARPSSGLRLTVTHAPNGGAHPHLDSMPRQRTPLAHGRHDRLGLSRSDPTGTVGATAHARLRESLLSRRGSEDGRLLSRPRRGTSPVIPPATPGPRAARAMLPPLQNKPTAPEGPEAPSDSIHSLSPSEGSEEDEEDEEEIYSDEEEVEQGPPSGPGFESEAERSAQHFDLPFLACPDPSVPFPATLLQDHAQLNMERFSAGAQASGLSSRANNIVRAFSLHGPLDRDLLSRALDSVASLHSLLAARFQRSKGKLYVQAPTGPLRVELETPISSHEKTEALIASARRKLFSVQLCSDLVQTDQEEGGEAAPRLLSLVSVVSSKSSEDYNVQERVERRPKLLLPSVAKKSVSFLEPPSQRDRPPTAKVPLPSLPSLSSPSRANKPPIAGLMRARLVQRSVQESILILSFSRIVCDFWSSCLFVRQLTEAYADLERSSTQRMSLAARRIEAKRRELVGKGRGMESSTQPRGYRAGKGVGLAGGRYQQQQQIGGGAKYTPSVTARLRFQQVALREKQLLKFVSKEKLWVFWDAMITATIQRHRGPNRVKVVPPIRIPSGLGEKVSSSLRPQTSRLRPFTARSRPQTGKKLTGDMASDWSAMVGPKTDFHFLKVKEEVCAAFRMSFPEEQLVQVREEDLLCLLTLSSYVLLLARCCRGWGREEEGGRDAHCSSKLVRKEEETITAPQEGALKVRDPLQHYKKGHGLGEGQRGRRTVDIPKSPARRTSRATMGGRLDLGSFLLGVELSLRHSHPKTAQGLFGPLSNDVGVRVNLSSCETFVDLVLAMGKSLQSARNHSHFPFTTVADELGIPPGLPVRFSFLHRSDTIQLTDPAHFYFPETAVGVKGHGLAKFGSNSYISPLCTKMDDSCHLELVLWEGADVDAVGGVFLFQPHLLRRDLVRALEAELVKLLVAVATDPTHSLKDLAQSISPPFSSSSRNRKRRTGHTHNRVI